MTNNEAILDIMDADSIGLEMSETIKNYKMLYSVPAFPIDEAFEKELDVLVNKAEAKSRILQEDLTSHFDEIINSHVTSSAPAPAVDLEKNADQLQIAQTTQESQGGGASIPENYFKCNGL